ncbi:MAG: electron transport complex subunit RsxC [Bacteroidales bacterium]|nr:electron transport complex subunit RsxC [Bacteroidales bacterium]
MNPIKTFPKGGVHPEENKLSSDKPIQNFPMPKHIIVPLGQCLGAPADPIVQKGDHVLTGQLIGTAKGFVSANVHSPATGTVTKIDVVMDHTGYYKPAVFIDVDDQEQWIEGYIDTDELLTEIKLAPNEIINKIKECGIVGMGGATFPTHVKLMIPEGKKAEYIIINAAECEPYLTCDNRLLLEKPKEFLMGVKILMTAVNAPKGIIGIECNKMNAIELLDKTINENRELYKNIEVQPLKTKYPQGGEKQIIKAVTGREVPSGKLPIETGCVVVNVASTFAIYEAVQKNKPLIERIVTVTGKSVKNPGNYRVRFGTPANLLIEAVGGLPENITNVINGGPMMGKAVSVTDFPCIKGTSGILLMTTNEAQDRHQTNCIRCGRCAIACPMGLPPFLLNKLSKLNMFDETESNHIMDCIECGSCEFTCPANIPLLDYIRYGKAKTGAIIRSRNQK